MTLVMPSDIDNGTLTVATNRTGGDDYDTRPRAVLARLMKQQLGLGPLEPLPSPYTIEFEPTLICKHKCRWCCYKEEIAEFDALRLVPGHEDDYGIEWGTMCQILEVLRAAGTTMGTFWAGGGEPLSWPFIVPAIRKAAEFTQVSLQTNGIALGKFMRKPADLACIRLLSFSVFADNAALHEQIAGVPSFDKVIANIRRAVAMRDQYGIRITISTKILVDGCNFRRLPEIVKFYQELGVDTVAIRDVQDYNYGGDGPRDPSVELTTAEREELAAIVAGHSFQSPVLSYFARSLMRRPTRPAVTRHCYNATDGHFACVDAHGDVTIGNPEIADEKFSIGNVTQTPWDQIWGGPRHHEVIALMDSMQQAGTCAATLCRHVRANGGVQDFLAGRLDPPDRADQLRGLGAFL